MSDDNNEKTAERYPIYPLMRVGELHARLGTAMHINSAFWMEWANAGKIPCLKADKQYLFNIHAVHDALVKMAYEFPEMQPPLQGQTYREILRDERQMDIEEGRGECNV